jgi:hypothetical protein
MVSRSRPLPATVLPSLDLLQQFARSFLQQLIRDDFEPRSKERLNERGVIYPSEIEFMSEMLYGQNNLTTVFNISPMATPTSHQTVNAQAIKAITETMAPANANEVPKTDQGSERRLSTKLPKKAAVSAPTAA